MCRRASPPTAGAGVAGVAVPLLPPSATPPAATAVAAAVAAQNAACLPMSVAMITSRTSELTCSSRTEEFKSRLSLFAVLCQCLNSCGNERVRVCAEETQDRAFHDSRREIQRDYHDYAGPLARTGHHGGVRE